MATAPVLGSSLFSVEPHTGAKSQSDGTTVAVDFSPRNEPGAGAVAQRRLHPPVRHGASRPASVAPRRQAILKLCRSRRKEAWFSAIPQASLRRLLQSLARAAGEFFLAESLKSTATCTKSLRDQEVAGSIPRLPMSLLPPGFILLTTVKNPIFASIQKAAACGWEIRLACDGRALQSPGRRTLVADATNPCKSNQQSLFAWLRLRISLKTANFRSRDQPKHAPNRARLCAPP
jgi:hypothetical protein